MDKKPFKGIHIYTHAWRNPFVGVTPNITCDANTKNRYNVFAAVLLKIQHPICTRVLEEVGDAIVFSEFVSTCLEDDVLQRGDILVVDNCTIHMLGENEHLQEVLLMQQGILMITHPPYYVELNPTELVFRTLLTRMRAIRCGSKKIYI